MPRKAKGKHWDRRKQKRKNRAPYAVPSHLAINDIKTEDIKTEDIKTEDIQPPLPNNAWPLPLLSNFLGLSTDGTQTQDTKQTLDYASPQLSPWPGQSSDDAEIQDSKHMLAYALPHLSSLPGQSTGDAQTRNVKPRPKSASTQPPHQWLGRAPPKQLLSFKARSVQAIFECQQTVKVHNIGSRLRTPTCRHCKALGWKDEVSGLCCNNGKVSLPRFPEPPDALKNLWLSDSVEAQLFRQYSRQVNRALALSSLKISQPTKSVSAGNPTLVIHGQVKQFIGPLQAEPGERPRFAQLYVHDSDEQNDLRKVYSANMRLPKTVTDEQKQMLLSVLETVRAELTRCNPYICDFILACNASTATPASTDYVISADAKPEDQDEHHGNEGFKQLSVLIPGKPYNKRDIVLPKQGGSPVVILDTHRSGNPLHFVLLFPRGTDGSNVSVKSRTTGKRVTARQFHAYHLQQRRNWSDSLFRAQGLFQEYCCVAYAKVEAQRLFFLWCNQPKLRSELYSSSVDAVDAQDAQGNEESARKRVILPSSLVGGPRYKHLRHQDALATVRKYHQPDLLITFLCNPAWPEISDALLNNQKPEDRPDLIARVFYLKLKSLVSEIETKDILGRVDAVIHTVEFGKNGLPRALILVILCEDDRLLTAADIDSVISTEIPPKYLTYKLRNIVLRNMIHGPCGHLNPDASCMKDSVCTKGFPKPFAVHTSWDNTLCSPTYRRRHCDDGGHTARLSNCVVDSSWVLPYNPYLTMTYNAQIIVEAGVSPMVVKSLYKSSSPSVYGERAKIRDEIQDYLDTRLIGAIEACWRLFGFPMSHRRRPVQILPVHLPGQEVVTCTESSDEATVHSTSSTKTPLTEFFAHNRLHPETNDSYYDFPETHVFNKRKLCWSQRQRNQGMISRIHTVHPLSGELFYLRMLLHTDQSKGATSFTDVRTVNGHVFETFKEACIQLGLVESDDEWDLCLTDAAATLMCPQLRALYVTVLLFCKPSDPAALFEKHYINWYDDLTSEIDNVTAPRDLQNLVLLDIEQQLQNMDKSLKDFSLPEIMDAETPISFSSELSYDASANVVSCFRHSERLTPSQRAVLDYVLSAASGTQPCAVFIDGRAGSGKTFLLNTILASVRTMENQKSIAIAVASNGIAASLLHLGRTFHSRFNAPLEWEEDSNLMIPVDSDLAELIRHAKVIVWDEAPMAHRFLLEALDRSLRDIMQNDAIFGGKVLVLAGDFRLGLPVLRNSTMAQTVDAAINRSPLWSSFNVFQLEGNMRVCLNGSGKDHQDYDVWLQSIGDGTCAASDETAATALHDSIILPVELSMPIDTSTVATKTISMQVLFNWVFSDLTIHLNRDWHTHAWMAERAILAPNNDAVTRINNFILQQFPGDELTCRGVDYLTDPSDATSFTYEYLNSIDVPGMPPHTLIVKPGAVLILLRDLLPRSGLCSGTRLILQTVQNNRLMHCKIASGEHSGSDVFIPRIDHEPNEEEFPCSWKRRQFPVRLAFAMTVEQSRGQTFKRLGVWLDQPVSSHGQLYMSASRVGDPLNIKFAVPVNIKPITNNVVCKEALSL